MSLSRPAAVRRRRDSGRGCLNNLQRVVGLLIGALPAESDRSVSRVWLLAARTIVGVGALTLLLLWISRR
jgi:hypothetical protein